MVFNYAFAYVSESLKQPPTLPSPHLFLLCLCALELHPDHSNLCLIHQQHPRNIFPTILTRDNFTATIRKLHFHLDRFPRVLSKQSHKLFAEICIASFVDTQDSGEETATLKAHVEGGLDEDAKQVGVVLLFDVALGDGIGDEGSLGGVVGLDQGIVVMRFGCVFGIVGGENLLDGWKHCRSGIWLEELVVVVVFG